MSYWTYSYFADRYYHGDYWPDRVKSFLIKPYPISHIIKEEKLDKVFNANLIFNIELRSNTKLTKKQVPFKLISDYSFYAVNIDYLLSIDEDLWLSEV